MGGARYPMRPHPRPPFGRFAPHRKAHPELAPSLGTGLHANVSSMRLDQSLHGRRLVRSRSKSITFGQRVRASRRVARARATSWRPRCTASTMARSSSASVGGDSAPLAVSTGCDWSRTVSSRGDWTAALGVQSPVISWRSPGFSSRVRVPSTQKIVTITVRYVDEPLDQNLWFNSAIGTAD
jgi:hypothetical protein